MSLVLGLDGGGTKSVLAVADRQGRVQVMRRGAGLSPSQGPWEARLETLLTGLPEVEAAILALPYHGEVAAHTAAQQGIALRLLGERAQVQNDVQSAFFGALAGRAGVLILAGTGAMAWAGDGARQLRVGGWGERIGDEGSAFWIGAQAVQALSQCLDRRRADRAFAQSMLAAMGIAAEALSDWVYGQPDHRLAMAGLAPAVTELAAAGNDLACAILDRAAQALALQVTTAWRLLGRDGAPVWSHAGGVFRSALALDLLQGRLGTPPLAPRLPPVGGALLQAARAAGWDVGEDWLDALAQSLADQALEDRRTCA